MQEVPEMKEPTKIIIYESAMCCASGVCGPNPDQTLIELKGILDDIAKSGVVIERYSITLNPKKFMENPQVIQLIQEQQLKVLPITIFNGNIIKVGSYPTKEELQASVNSKGKTEESPAAQTTAKPEECCSGKDYCDIRRSPHYSNDCSGEKGNSCCS
jgi:hypothetical protein